MYTFITLALIFGIGTFFVRNRRLHHHIKQLLHEFDETSLILESLNDGLIECDRDMVIVRMNHAAEKILGLEAASVINRSFPIKPVQTPIEKLLGQVLNPPKDVAPAGLTPSSYDVYPQALGAGDINQHEFTKLRIYTVPKTDPSSKLLLGYVKIVRDVSIETAVDTHKKDLVSIVSHQLLSPLTGTKWILKSILDGDAGAVTAKQSDMIKRAIGTNEQMVRLVGDILDVSKVEQAKFAYKFEPVQLSDFIKKLVETADEKAQAKNIRIETEILTGNKTLIVDRARMGIAVTNLIDNAVDYSPAGRAVKVKVDSGAKGGVNISVTDKGIGIPEAEKDKLFVKFYRAENAKRVRTSGTGLGLYLAKHIVEAHSGSLSVTSGEGDGSTFTISLPDKPLVASTKSQGAFV